MARQIVDRLFLEAALIGLELRKASVDEKVADLQKQIGSVVSIPFTTPTRSQSRMSVAARRRIGMAQKRRWRAYRAAKAALA
jgi:hypothetical protein